MARQARNETGPGLYHVVARGNNQEFVFRDDSDKEDYIRRLKRVLTRYGWRVLQYQLMDNHIHLLIETTRPTLGDGMRLLQGAYAQAFNRKYGRSGHLWQGRYFSRPITSDGQFLRTVRYIARNATAAGLVAAPGEWPWDSWAETIGSTRVGVIDAKRFFDLLGDSRNPAETYRMLVANDDGIDELPSRDPPAQRSR